MPSFELSTSCSYPTAIRLNKNHTNVMIIVVKISMYLKSLRGIYFYLLFNFRFAEIIKCINPF